MKPLVFAGTCTVLTLSLLAGRSLTVQAAENPQRGGKSPQAAAAQQTGAAPQTVAPQTVAPQTVQGHTVATEPAAEDVKFFTQSVRPVLAQNCYRCHTSEAMGGLRLDSRAAVLKGGDSGPAVVAGSPDKSLLMAAVLQNGAHNMDAMPPKGHKLSDPDIAALAKWISAGLAWDPGESAQPPIALMPVTLVPNADVKTPGGQEFFETRVRPILSTQCGSCHEAHGNGGLSLATREAILKGGNSGPAMVPGDPEHSLLLTAAHGKTELKMPPDGPQMNDADLATLTEWIKMGAPWGATTAVRVDTSKVTAETRSWWSFRPLEAPAMPTAAALGASASWARTDIDRLVLARMQSKGLKPAVQADKRTLIRRATMDLTGLPPTEADVIAFLADSDPKAYEKVIDRLLASSSYGERWGRHWLDVARYADDDVRGLDPRGRGYMPMTGAYVYRDWVIKAVNADMPYDQFVRLQLAGDKMLKPEMTKEQKQSYLEATSFLGAGPWIWDQAEPLQGRADERNERIDAVTRGYLGLTVACARCHDHKYDPVLMKDYYALGGIFASSDYKEYALVPESEEVAWKRKFEKSEAVSDALSAYTKTESQQLSRALASQTSAYMVGAWQVTGKPKMKLEDVAERAKLDPEQLERFVKFTTRKQSFYPNLKDWQLMVAQGGAEDQAKYLGDLFQQQIEDLEIEATKMDEDNKKIIAKADVPILRKKDAKPNEFNTYDEFCPGCTLELKVMSTERANLYSDLFIRALSSGDMTAERGEPGLFAYRGWGMQRRLGAVEQQYIADLTAESKKLKSGLPEQYPFVHGFTDKKLAADIPIDLRGSPSAHGPVVQRAFLTVLSPADPKPYSAGSGRLELAEDIVQSPLAARVVVNRVWKWHFGTGIVNSPDNFGKVGDPPSNPELLDYLALSFKADGMSLKKLQKRIMLSAVYQESAHESKEAHEVDPNNRLYSHFSMQRLDAEELRDSILFVAGDLDTKEIGGPATELGTGNLKRTVYAKVSRFRIDPFLQSFDFPNPSFTAEQRFSTNVPVQRLYFMNNTWVYAQAEKLADRVYPKGDDTARITEAYLILFNRKPSPAEMQTGLEYLKSTPEKPGYMVAQQPLTAWKQYARILMSSNEFEFLN